MTDDQFVDGLRSRQPFKRIAAPALVIVGLIISVAVAVWGFDQRSKLSQSFDELALLAHPSTLQADDGIRLSRDATMFAHGAGVGMLFIAGLSMAFGGFSLLLDRRKDRLLLAERATSRRSP